MKLTRFLRKCKGEGVKIETKEGLKVEGNIVSVDKTMNVELSNAVVDGSSVGVYNIRGSSIRYIIFRNDIDFKPLLVDDRPRNKVLEEEKIKRRKGNI